MQPQSEQIQYCCKPGFHGIAVIGGDQFDDA